MNKPSVFKLESTKEIKLALMFLKTHEETSQFLINNLRDHGPVVTEDPYSGNFKVIKEADEIVAVFYLARCGNLYAEAKNSSYVDLILDSCKQEPFPLKGFLGSWELLHLCYERYMLKYPSFKPSYFSKDILYRLLLEKNNSKLEQQPSVRLLTNTDFKAWFPLRLSYMQELHLPFEMSEEQLKVRFNQATENKTWWGFFDDDNLLSIAGLNSKSDTIGQIGGVFTPKELRKRGLSKATMLHMLKDCQDLHGLTKSILFTGETDTPAQKLYESIGYEQIGHFALIL